MGGGSRRHQINEGEDTLEGKLGVDGRWRWIYPVLVLILIGLVHQG